MSEKRKMWVMVCGIFALIWFALGIFIWPLLFFALSSGLMILIPVGVPDDQPVKTRHNPNAWSENTKE